MSPLAIQQGTFHFAASSFSYPPDSSSLHSMGVGRRLGGGSMEEYYSSCLHVKPDCRQVFSYHTFAAGILGGTIFDNFITR